MQDLEDNIENIFRNAADNYMLNSGNSKWDEIVVKLNDDEAEPAITKYKKTSFKNKLMMLLLLLFLCTAAIFIINYFVFDKEIKHTVLQNNTIKSDQKITPKEKIFADKNVKEDKTITQLNDIKSNKNIDLSIQNVVNDLSGNTPLTVKNKPESLKEEPAVLINNPAETITPYESPITINKEKNPDNDKTKKDKKIIVAKNQKGIYLGVMGGPIFSEIKQQGFTKPGYDIGIIAGYKFNNPLSIETGILLAKKSYFSNGKYFSMEKMGASMPSDMKMVSINGSSNFIEIPVRLKYDILHKKKTNIFSSVGITSNLLTKENNDYVTSVNGTQQNMKGLYNTASASFASSVDFSIGYEHLFKHQSSIRIEPYIHIPVKGTGIGNMQVISTGLHLSVTQFLH